MVFDVRYCIRVAQTLPIMLVRDCGSGRFLRFLSDGREYGDEEPG
jgi:hypothetical protein